MVLHFWPILYTRSAGIEPFQAFKLLHLNLTYKFKKYSVFKPIEESKQ